MATSTNFYRVIHALTGVYLICFSVNCSPEKNAGEEQAILPGSWAGNSGSQTVTGDSNGSAGAGNVVIPSGVGGSKAKGSTVSVGDKCVDQDIQVTRQTPVVMLVIDRSGSTNTAYGNSNPDAGAVVTRWQALHDAIMDPNSGVVAKTQSQIVTGVILYDGGDLAAAASDLECMLDPTKCSECPRLITVAPAKNNYNNIAAQYNETNAGPGGTTPTAAALKEAYAQIEKQISSVLDVKANPTPVVILVTDGEPNGCGLPPIADYQGPANEVTAATKKGIKTYVIGIDTSKSGTDTPAEVQPNLDKLAKLGNTGVDKAYTPSNKEQLSKTLISLLGGASCEVKLNGKIAKGWEDKGTVLLSSVKLAYKDANGYIVNSESTITLQGNACDKFMKDNTVILHADFPCEGFVLE